MRTIKNSFLLILLLGVFVSAMPVSEKRDTSSLYNDNMFTPLTIPAKTDQPQTRKYTLKLSQTQWAPDGFTRSTYLVNNQYPGPILQANKGDWFSITVENDIPVETSMHWHGMFQRGTSWFDGVPAVSQCTITPGSSLTYEFSTEGQIGTYWWHSHYNAQYIDGILGALIIHDPEDPYLKDYDYEYVVTLTDWYHQTSADLLALFLAPGYSGGNPVPDAGLISGKGQFNCDAKPGYACKKDSDLAVYKVQKGKKYRFRIINTSGEAFFVFSIDGHKMKVIEVEGTYVQPFEVTKLPLHIAQRYSVIVEADQDAKDYWIRATMSSECIPNNGNTTINHDSAINYNVTGILSYEGSSDKSPDSTPYTDDVTPCRNLDSKLIKPLTASPPKEATQTISYFVTFGRNEKNVTEALMNNSSYVPDYNSPTTLKVIDDHVDVKTLPTSQNIEELNDEKGVVEITHGHTFWLIGDGVGNYTDNIDKSSYNTVDPPIRDTTVVPAHGWSTIRFTIDNPGVWVFHCHIEWHIEIGMLAQFVELPDQLKSQKIPDSIQGSCSNRAKY
ncbi:Multicopper oxidase [Gigaspora rosea]|uniref:Multicopper oxidase n=1 Tax=Gigaspora rosea TaxID=44941 RepID=A0A397ULG7_9GLOM|nr:Multicopper oxidase [Gigaspora rosea]